MLHRYLHGQFVPDMATTIGVEFFKKNLVKNDTDILLSIWDLGGQDRFRFIQSSYVFGANGAIVFFDMTRLSTAIQVGEWVSFIRENTRPDIPIILGGTKLDVVEPDQKNQINEDARTMVKELQLSGYMTTSAKNGENVNNIFDTIAEFSILHPEKKS